MSIQSSLSEMTCQWMIAKGYSTQDLDSRGENGDTALMKATREGSESVVRELIDAGADVNARNNDGNNALWFACFGVREAQAVPGLSLSIDRVVAVCKN